MSNTFMRVGTANMYDNALRNLVSAIPAWWACRTT